MSKNYSVWVLVLIASISIAVGVGVDRLVIAYHRFVYQPSMRRDLNDLDSQLRLGDKRARVIQRLGPPGMVANSLAELEGEPYRLGPPSGEEILLYYEYPWGIIIYVDKKDQAISRIMLARHL